MKTKINKWGNSHGIRLSAAMLEHLDADKDSEVEVKMTANGIELIKTTSSLEKFQKIKLHLQAELLKKSNPVKIISHPNQETDCDYIVIDINPSKPIIREVEKGYKGGYKTLSKAKQKAHQLIQQTIAEAKLSLAEVRQTGIKKIQYLKL